MDVEVRKIRTPEEYAQTRINSAIVFNYEIDIKSDSIKDPVKDGDKYGIFEDGKLVSQIYSYHFQMLYHGKYVPMFGIGDVCTLVEARNKGYVRRLFHNVFDIEREAGYVFSYLYPFSNEYYGKFGYGYGNNVLNVEIPLDRLEGHKCEYDVRMYQSGDPYEPYTEVFEKYAEQYTGAILRPDRGWLDDHVPAKNRKSMFLFTENGVPKAFVGFKTDHGQGGSLHIEGNIAWDSPEAFSNILGFLYAYRMHNDKVYIRLPDSFPIEFMLKEQWGVKYERFITGQVRVIDVKKALEFYPWSEDAGEVLIGVNDDYFTDQSGVYRVIFGGELGFDSSKATVEKCAGDVGVKADIYLNIKALSPLMLGVYGYDDLMHLCNDSVTVNRNEALLRKVFIRRPVYITERF